MAVMKVCRMAGNQTPRRTHGRGASAASRSMSFTGDNYRRVVPARHGVTDFSIT